MRDSSRHFCVLAAAIIALPFGILHAAVIHDNFGPGDTYQPNIGLTIAGPLFALGGHIDQAGAFTPEGSDYVLEAVELGMGWVQGPNELDVWLMTDSGGLPDTIIESFHFSDAMGTFGILNPPLYAASVLKPLLKEGVQYWLAASADADTWAAWAYNSTGAIGPGAVRSTGPWGYAIPDPYHGAYRITGTVIPEPATLSLVALGGLGLLRKRRKR